MSHILIFLRVFVGCYHKTVEVQNATEITQYLGLKLSR